MMNLIWPIMIFAAFVSSIVTGSVDKLSQAVIAGGENAVQLMLRLLSMLCLWGGIMETASRSGITAAFSRLLYPLMKRLFPRLRDEKYALEAISMNVTANILGLGNAATPLGLEAMRRLEQLNPTPGTASDEMVVFVVMNTAAMHIIPTTVATMRGQYGSANPMEIMPASLLTSACALAVAVFLAKAGNKIKIKSARPRSERGRRGKRIFARAPRNANP